jgi:hypothetical protein
MPTLNVESSKISTDNVSELPQTTVIAVTMPREISSELPSSIAEDSTQEFKEEEKSITESSITTALPTESKVSHIDVEMTTAGIPEKGIEALTSSEFNNVFTTQKQIEELEQSSTKPSIIDGEGISASQSDLNTTERELSEETTSIINEAEEKSSESSSPISEITTTEQSSSEKITDSLLHTSNKESDKPVDDTNALYHTTERDPNTVGYTALKMEDKFVEEYTTSGNYEIPTSTSSEENNKIEKLSTPFIFENETVYSDDKQSERTNAPINTELTTEINPDNTKKTEEIDTTKIIESSTDSSSNEPIEDKEIISSMNVESSTVDTSIYNNESELPNESTHIEFATASSEDGVKIAENIDTVTSAETSTLINLDESSDKQSEEASASLSTEIPIKDNFHDNKNGEVTNETINPLYLTTEESLVALDNSSVTDTIVEKTNNEDASSEFNTENKDHENLPLEENNEAIEIPEQGSTEILKPERGPEHKAEDNDAVTDTLVTEGNYINGNEISHNIDGLQTNHPEYESSTYLPTQDLSNQTNQQPSTSLYDALPKEDSEIESYTTQFSITSKSPAEKTTVDYIDELAENNKPEENIQPIEPNIHTLEKEQTSDPEISSGTIPIEEASTKPVSSTNLPVEEFTHKTVDISTEQESTEKENIQNLTIKPLIEDIATETPILNDYQKKTTENITEPEVKSEITLINNESTHSMEMTVPSTFKDDHTETMITETQNINENKPQIEEEISVLSKENELVTEAPDIEEDIDQSPKENPILVSTINPTDKEELTTIASLEINHEKLSESMNKDHITDELSTVTQLTLSEPSLDTSNPSTEKETLEDAIENTEASTINEALETDELSKATDKDSTVTEKLTEEEHEYTSSSEASVNAEYDQSSDTSISPDIPINNEESLKDIIITEHDNQNESIGEDKFNINPESPEKDTITDIQEESVAHNLDKELITTVESTEQFTEKSQSPDNMYQNKNELGYSTEINPMTSQAPEMEIKIPLSVEERPAPGIPGEGNCLVDGQSYSNNSAIPPANACQLSCRCVSSIVQCELIQCSPPPADLPNCVPMYTSTDSCCPMYTCDSPSSVELEADNQMSDHHLSTYEDKIQTETPQNPSVEEHLPNSEIITNTEETKLFEQVTESTIISQPEILESASITSDLDKLTISPISSVEKQTTSPLIPLETTSITFEESSAPINIAEETSPAIIGERNKDDEENESSTSDKITDEDTSLINTEESTTIEAVNEENDVNLPSKLDVEHPSQTENNEVKESIIGDDDLHKPNSENVDLAITEMITNNTSEGVEITTQNNLLTQSENETKDDTKLLVNTENIYETTASEVQEPTYETTVASIEPIENETLMIPSNNDELLTSSVETKPTSLDTSENTTPIVDDKLVEKEVEQSNDSDLEQYIPVTTESNSIEVDELSTDSSTELSITEKQFTQSTSILSIGSTTKPEENELENLPTLSPDNQSTLLSIISESTESDQENNSVNNYTQEDVSSEKTVEFSGVTSNELSSTISSTLVEDHSTVEIFVTESEEKQPLIPASKSESESESEAESGVTDSLTEDEKLTSPNIIETTESTIEKEEEILPQLSSVTQLYDANTEKNELPDIKVPEEAQNKFESDADKTESEENIKLESITKKLDEQRDELTTSHEELLNQEFGTVGQETVTQSTKTEEYETEIKIKPTESLIEHEKDTIKPDNDKNIETESEIKVTEQNELLGSSEIEKEVTKVITTTQSVLHEPSIPSFDDRLSTNEEIHDPVEPSTDILLNKTLDESKLEDTTLNKENEETLSHETSTTIGTTNVEAYLDKEETELHTEHPNKDIVNESTSNENPEDEQKGHFTEATTSELSTTNLTPSQNPNEKEQNTSSIVSEEPATAFGIATNEIQTTLSNDLHEHSTKATIPQGELTSIETSEVTNSEDDQYHVDSHQTEEPMVSATHDNDEQRPVESYSTTLHPDISKPHKRPEFPDQQTTETDDENVFPPDTADIKNPFNTDDADSEDYDDQAVYGPGTCRYGGKIYMSAQQIPRDDACDFCFCFRSDIICLQQSCPPPIPGCHEEPIGGFCCPRYECPVSMAISLNLTTTTTTTTTTLPPHFLSHAYKGGAFRGGCQIGNRAYRVGEDIKSKSGPCMSCM